MQQHTSGCTHPMQHWKHEKCISLYSQINQIFNPGNNLYTLGISGGGAGTVKLRSKKRFRHIFSTHPSLLHHLYMHNLKCDIFFCGCHDNGVYDFSAYHTAPSRSQIADCVVHCSLASSLVPIPTSGRHFIRRGRFSAASAMFAEVEAGYETI